MFLGKDIIGNPVITVSDGRNIGRVKDIYLTPDCQSVAAIYLGSEGLFSRESFLVLQDDVVVIGTDATLVKHSDVIHEVSDVAEAETWLRRDELQGRPVDTPGGTKVGKVGDAILDKSGRVLGFSLSHVYVAGPVAENRSIALHTVQDIGTEDGSMTVDLQQAEQQKLSMDSG
ncbi:MAG TPA: PRC-barrel domain-containing protein [Anaerolineae bacterium]